MDEVEWAYRAWQEALADNSNAQRELKSTEAWRRQQALRDACERATPTISTSLAPETQAARAMHRTRQHEEARERVDDWRGHVHDLFSMRHTTKPRVASRWQGDAPASFSLVEATAKVQARAAGAREETHRIRTGASKVEPSYPAHRSEGAKAIATDEDKSPLRWGGSPSDKSPSIPPPIDAQLANQYVANEHAKLAHGEDEDEDVSPLRWGVPDSVSSSPPLAWRRSGAPFGHPHPLTDPRLATTAAAAPRTAQPAPPLLSTSRRPAPLPTASTSPAKARPASQPPRLAERAGGPYVELSILPPFCFSPRGHAAATRQSSVTACIRRSTFQ